MSDAPGAVRGNDKSVRSLLSVDRDKPVVIISLATDRDVFAARSQHHELGLTNDCGELAAETFQLWVAGHDMLPPFCWEPDWNTVDRENTAPQHYAASISHFSV